jgi:hypothetical protein
MQNAFEASNSASACAGALVVSCGESLEDGFAGVGKLCSALGAGIGSFGAAMLGFGGAEISGAEVAALSGS